MSKSKIIIKHTKFTNVGGELFAMSVNGDEGLFDLFIAAKKLELAQKEYTEKVIQYGYQQGIKPMRAANV